MKTGLFTSSLCALILASPLAAAGIVTLKSLVAEMTDRAAVARWPDPEFSGQQSSSHDRRTVSPDQPGWFANDDHTQYIRDESRDGHTEHVMMDEEGPGCITRFWLTTVENKKGVLRVYLDGAAEPVLVFPACDLMAGGLDLTEPILQPHPGYTPSGNGGNTLVLPIPYASHCKVTWEEQGSGPRYYKIDFRRYAPGTQVETFTRAALEKARPAVIEAGRKLLEEPRVPEKLLKLPASAIDAGKQVSLDLPSGPAAVDYLELHFDPQPKEQMAAALRSTIVMMTCDDEKTVWCPAGDFFGSGVGLNELKSWYRSVRADGTMICRWIMPYRKSARITLFNAGSEQVDCTLRAETVPWQWDERTMHFHAAWHYEANLHTPPARDWNLVQLKGRGVYVGDTLSLYNPAATWYGEGDEKIRVDGEKIPSHIGTGTEDYYNYSFAPRGIIQTPFANQIRVDDPSTQGHNVLTRSRNLDGIPYRKSLDFDIELISWKPTNLIYAATTYWYAFPGGSSNRSADIAGATAAIPTLDDARGERPALPNMIEAEQLEITARTPGLVTENQDMQNFGFDVWSRGHQLLGRATGGNFVELRIPAPDGQPRRIYMTATQAPDYGMLAITVNGKEATSFDGYAPDVIHANEILLGSFEPTGGAFNVRIQVRGTHPASKGARFYFGIDGFRLGDP